MADVKQEQVGDLKGKWNQIQPQPGGVKTGNPKSQHPLERQMAISIVKVRF